MKITKYNQSCLLIETKGKRILIDPGKFGYIDERLEKDWTNIDVILITHKHSDHCYKEIIEEILKRDESILYVTEEIQNIYSFENANIVKETDTFNIGDIKVEVTHAMHGYLTGTRERDVEILENVGYIIDDGNARLYTTSDTINFYNDYKCEVLCMPFNGNGLTMGVTDGVDFAKAINPKLLLPIHTEHPNPIMNPNIDELCKSLEDASLNYKILNIGESVEL